MATTWIRVFGFVFATAALVLFVFAFAGGDGFGSRVLSAFTVFVVAVAFWLWADMRKVANRGRE